MGRKCLDRVLEAGNGAEALEIARRRHERIDLLLTDVIMPVMGGVELAERFAQLQPDAVVTYMSGYTDRPMPEDLKGKLLQKPFMPATLQRHIGETMPLRRGESSSKAGDQ